MSENRRDNKNRILRTGESQRSDGRYEYKYTDITGERKSVYSWRLVSTDRNQPGKRSDFSLRELEEQIKRDLEDGLRTDMSKMKLKELAELYLENTSVKESTKTNYCNYLNASILPFMGNMYVKDVSEAQIRKFYMYLINEKQLKGNSVRSISIPLSAIFSFAKKLKIIKENPAKGVLKEFERGLKKANRAEL